MHDERTGRPRDGQRAEGEDQTDSLILALLVSSQFPGLWSIVELEQEVGNPMAVAESIRRLHGQGLVHRLGDFVFVTHAAACYEELRV